MAQNGESNSDESPRASLDQFTKRAGIVVGMLGMFVLLGLLVIHSITIVFLVLASVLWALFLLGPAVWLHKKTSVMPLRAWVLIVLFVLLAVGGGLVVLSAPSIADQYQRVAETFPKAYQAFQDWVSQSELGTVLPEIPDPEKLFSGESASWSRVTGAFTGALGVVGNSLLIFFVGIYFALAPDMYKFGLVRLFPLNYRDRAEEVLAETGSSLGWWLISRLISMAAVAILTTVGLWVLGVPLALVLGIISGLLAFVPVVGPIVSTVPAALLALLRGPMTMLYVILLYVVVQALENYLLMPYLAQRAVHLPPALVILAQVLLGLLTGFLGVLMATPLLVVVMVLVDRFYVEDTLGETEAERPDSTQM